MNPADMMRNSLGAYSLMFFKAMQFSWHHKKIIKALKRVESGECKRLLISAPPRHSKSILVNEFFPAWAMGKKPERQIICATYGQSLSLEFGRRVKSQMTSSEYRQIFPECQVMHDSKAAERISTTARGVYHATSIGGAVTGKGADIFIIDDPVKDRQEAESEVIRENIWNWYLSVARTRLQPNGAIIIIQTRWHEMDLTGRILLEDAGKDRWEHIHLKAISDDGKALWPEWMPIETLQEIKEDIKSYEWNALYQGEPAPLEGNHLKVKHLRYYERCPHIPRLIQVIDSAIKEGKENDYTVILTLGVFENKIFCVDLWRDKVAYPKLKQMVREKYQQFYPTKIVIEDKASGQQLIQELSEELPIKSVPGIDDPIQRIGILSDYVELGRIYLPKDEAYTEDIKAEFRAYPNGAHDDIVMTFAYGAQELQLAKINAFYKGVWEDGIHEVDIKEMPPRHWPRFRSMTWSPSYPFCVLWWVITNNDEQWSDRWWPEGSITIIKEWYGGINSKGVKLSADQVSKRILLNEKKWGLGLVRPGPAGSESKSSLWSKDKGPSLFEIFAKNQVQFVPAFKDRIMGLSLLKNRLIGHEELPMIYFSGECVNTIDAVKTVSRHPKDEEDIAKDQYHSPAIAVTYICHSYKSKLMGKKKEVKLPIPLMKERSNVLDDGFGY